MKHFTITFFAVFLYSSVLSCSFFQISFCNTITTENPDNVILRGYFSEATDHGLIFTRLETLRGDEDRSHITIWDNLPFDCNGLHEREATFLGNMDQEIIISVAVLDTFIFEGEVEGDYRTPDGVWWETHSLKVDDETVSGYIYNTSEFPYYQEVAYDDFVETIINNSQCTTTSTTTILKNAEINIYPTLVQDRLNLDYKQDSNDYSIDIYNHLGQKSYSSKISPQINLGLLTKGMYVVVVHYNGRLLQSEKIVKL